jgi:hypothetical protein
VFDVFGEVTMWYRARLAKVLNAFVLAALPFALAVGAASDAGAGEWSLRVEPTFMQAHGHDQHVMTIHEIDLDAIPQVDHKTAVALDTENGLSYRGEFRYSLDKWAWGVDITVFFTDQSTDDRTGAAGGSIDQVVFEVADRSFVSSDPGEVLLFTILEDTSLQTWTVDMYALRTLVDGPQSSLQLQLGIRNADFDNDFRAVVGDVALGGRRIDASSNYSRMMGPLVGLLATIERGRSQFEGYISQSVLLGEADLTSGWRDFTGPLSSAFPVEEEVPNVTAQETFRKSEDAAIPVTDFRIRWTYRLGKRISVGLGANTSVWWDVPLPPGIIPIEDGDEVLHENTIVFVGGLATVAYTF